MHQSLPNGMLGTRYRRGDHGFWRYFQNVNKAVIKERHVFKCLRWISDYRLGKKTSSFNKNFLMCKIGPESVFQKFPIVFINFPPFSSSIYSIKFRSISIDLLVDFASVDRKVSKRLQFAIEESTSREETPGFWLSACFLKWCHTPLRLLACNKLQSETCDVLY